MQEFISVCKNRCGYKAVFWILMIYLLQVQIISAQKVQSPPEHIPDSDEIIILNSTSTSGNDTSLQRILTNVDAHISDFIPKENPLPKKVSIEDVASEKQKFTEKMNEPNKGVVKAMESEVKKFQQKYFREPSASPTIDSEDTKFPPKHFPKDADEVLSHKDVSMRLEKLLHNTKEEHSDTSAARSSSGTTEFPPKYLPTSSISVNNVTIPLIVSHSGQNFSKLLPVFPTSNTTELSNNGSKKTEAFDMTHSTKYLGQFDVDDVKGIAEKLNKTEGKHSEADPKSQVAVSNNMDQNGPKSMPANKIGFGVLSSTSNVVALSSAVLSSKSPKSDSMLEPIKAIAATVMTIVGMTILGMAGFLLWRRIIQRRFGHREMLINEDDFEEVADLHHFQGTTPIAPTLIA